MQSPFLTHFYSHIQTSNRTQRSPLENKVTDLPSPANAVGSDLILRGVSRGPLARAGVIFVERSGRDRLVLRTGVLILRSKIETSRRREVLSWAFHVK